MQVVVVVVSFLFPKPVLPFVAVFFLHRFQLLMLLQQQLLLQVQHP
jgi:hypothetical protein